MLAIGLCNPNPVYSERTIMRTIQQQNMGLDYVGLDKHVRWPSVRTVIVIGEDGGALAKLLYDGIKFQKQEVEINRNVKYSGQ